MARYETLHTRFYRHVFPCPMSGCHLWDGSSNAKYGWIYFNGRFHAAHRVSWLLNYGYIPPGLFVLHKCDNGFCVNPDHLFLGTLSDNAKDAFRKGRLWINNNNGAARKRLRAECKRGHKWPDNLRKRSNGEFECLACRREWERSRSKCNKQRPTVQAVLAPTHAPDINSPVDSGA